ncbi:MAG: acyl-CoA dehydrogenase C-terminal domain-containing protein [Candidatus Actinomarina sp.]|nr:acyl-CoA dehydrogenase C-terminal domain-containing protein [Candidatus Actinomarinales bacterium]|tara:strand:- start:2200 stop:3987 length:1788 start_codon:yes stop_codon:yes gene_type:complete
MAVSYKAPVKDIVFGYEVIDSYNVLNKIAAFSDFSEDVVVPTMEECAKFSEEVLAPINAIGDQQGATIDNGVVTMPEEFVDAYKKFSDAGWASISLPEEIGGGGMPITLSGGTLEILSTANLAFGLAPGLSAGAISAINFHGSQEQKDKFLPKLVSGEWTGTMNLSEPQSGSDLGTITTKAEAQEDGTYKVTGTKVWITFGEHNMTENIIHLVLAKVPGSPEGTKGISMFIVPKFIVNDDGSLGENNNVSCISIEEKLGIHASPTCVMEYDGSVGYLVGEENRGLTYMFTMMNEARVWVGGQGLACASGALQGAAQYARDRVQGRPVGMSKEDAKNSTIMDHADVRRMLLTIKAYVDAMRYLMYDNQLMLDLEYFGEGELKEFGEERCGILTPITKAWISDLGVELSSIAIQVYGGMGYVEETGVAQYLRDARIAPIYEGTNGIQALDLIFRKLPLDSGQAMQRLLGDVNGVIEEMSQAGDVLSSMSEKLKVEVDKLSEVTLWLGSKMLEGELVDASAGASPYIKMFGQVLGGYYMGKAALLATKKYEETGDEYYAEKITLSKFYIEQLLPLASGYASAVTAGKEDLYNIKAENF